MSASSASPAALDGAVPVIGYAVEHGIAVDYVCLGHGIIAGMLIGMVIAPITGSPVALDLRDFRLAIICGALAGSFTCTAGLNVGNETSVLGYTVPYAILNVRLTLMGPILVLTV